MERWRENVDEKQEDHEERIICLEKKIQDTNLELSTAKNEMKSLRYSVQKMERTLFDQNAEQSKMLEKVVYQTLDIKRDTNKNKKEIIIAAIGGGGVLYAIIELAQRAVGG